MSIGFRPVSIELRNYPWLLPLGLSLLVVSAACSSSSAGAAGNGGSGSAGIAAGASGGSGTVTGGGAAGTLGSAGAATGGRAGSAGSAGSGGSADHFVLAWQDEFDTIDSSRWELENFTWDGNQAQFTPQNASAANGIVTISLTDAPQGSTKPYLGVEMRSKQTLTYGKVSARMRFATGSGVVSGLVLIYTPFPSCDWNEIDIEHLGNSSNTSQLNTMVYMGTPMTGCTTSVTPTPDPLVANLGFNAESDFHLYDVEWTPAGVSYFADGVLLRTWTKDVELLRLPQNILLTIWASNMASWAGPPMPSSAPTTADVDWIKVYNWRE